jgi:hypothetical protein
MKPKEVGRYGYQADEGVISDLVYQLVNKNDELYGILALSLKHTEQNSEIKIGINNIKKQYQTTNTRKP